MPTRILGGSPLWDRSLRNFARHQARIVIEVDGSQHMNLRTTDTDAARTNYLAVHGHRVLRFWNNDVLKNIDAVLAAIHEELARGLEDAPHPHPLPTARRGRSPRAER